MIRIITDSTNDLDKETLEKHNVMVLPLYVNFSDASYKDGVDITTPELYKLVSEKKELPKTAAIPMQTFITVFQEIVDQGDEVIFTGISKQMSKTYENAVLASREVNEEKIFVVDSMNLSTGIGLLVLKACKYRDEGKTAKEIALLLNQDNKRVLSQFAIETMEYLHKGGRCSSLAKIFGTLLKIKPMIAVRDGKMHVAKKPHGKMQVALDIMIEQIKKDLPRLDPDMVIVTHSLAFESNDYIRSRLSEFLGDIPILSTVAGCVISSHCGQGTIGILYMVKDEHNDVNEA
ncbi:MAG: DegV family protein [Anaeroplasmataceae bacterium]|nr:DegV family protein [Anaeroplasmataceae bacterium]